MEYNGSQESSIFATTALVAFAGAASADVTITGSAEMGIAGGSGTTQTTFIQSVDVKFAMTGTSDNGLSFGATLDLEDVIDSATNVSGNVVFASDLIDDAGSFADYTVFVSGTFGTLTMGDTDGALDWALQEVDFNGAGSIGDNHTGHAGFNGNGIFDGIYNGQVLRYDYTIGAFGVALSAEVDNNAFLDGDAMLGIGFRYNLDIAGGDVRLGLGYQTVGDTNRTFANVPVAAPGPAPAGDQGFSVVGVSAAVALDMGLSAAINYSQISSDAVTGYFGGDGEHTAIGFTYTFDAITLHANYGEYDWDATALLEDSTGYGLSASYDFGGGLTANIGYGSSDIGATNNFIGRGAAAPVPAAFRSTARVDSSSWSLGVRMSF